MDRAEAFLVVLPLGDPHLLEGVQGGEDGAADPGAVEALLGRRDPDLDVFGSQLLDLGQETVAEPLEESGATGEDDVLEENFPQVHVRLLYGVDEHLRGENVIRAGGEGKGGRGRGKG